MGKIVPFTSNVGIDTPAANGSPHPRMVRDDELDTVSGGFIFDHGSRDYREIVSPRDPASGLPTGK
jgi:hypothetical protein